MFETQDMEFAKTIMPMFIESAKGIAQLAAGALVLSIGFQERVLGKVGRKYVTHSLALAWFLLLVAIGTSALYQYTAIHFIPYLLDGQPQSYSTWLEIFLAPDTWYAAMLISFFGGATLLVARCAHQLFLDKAARQSAK